MNPPRTRQPDGTLGLAATGPGEVSGLILGKGPGAGELTLRWGPSCAAGADYGVFEGSLAAVRSGSYDHAPTTCADAAPLLEEIVAPPAGDTYYLVVPLDASAEGSHGTRTAGGVDTERPVGAGQCLPAQSLGCP